MEFEADPDYKLLSGLENQPYDFSYDWVSEKPEINDNVAIERYIKKNYNVS